MSLLSFLSNRQISATRNTGFPATCRRFDFDDQLSRLVTYDKDIFSTYTNFEVQPSPPFVCKFRKDRESDLLALANEEGQIMLVDTLRCKILKSFIAHKNAIFDICWLPDKNHMLTVSGDHNVHLFDMNTCQLISSYHGHTASVKSVDVCPTESDMFATGSRDGNICIWDRREKCGEKNNKPSNCITGAHSRKESPYRRGIRSKSACNLKYQALSSISVVAFQDNTHLVSSGVADGLIKVWDLRRTYVMFRNYSPRYEMSYNTQKYEGHGCTSMVFDYSHKKLYASTTAHEIYRFDCHTYSNDGVVYNGLKCSTYFVKLDLSCDDQYLLCGSSDNTAYIWNINKPGMPIVALPGHEAEVTSVAWSPYSISKLATVGDDHRLMIWRVQDADSDYKYKAMSGSVQDESESPILEDHLNSNPKIELPSKQKRKNSLQDPKTTPIGKSITNFYSPLTPSLSLQNITTNLLTSPESQGRPSPENSAVVSPRLQPSCKAMRDSNLVSNVVATTPPKSSPEGKENDTVPMIVGESSTAMRTIGQVKRKLNAHKSITIICKYHPEGCGRSKGHAKCGKRIILTPDSNSIKKYFTVSPPE